MEHVTLPSHLSRTYKVYCAIKNCGSRSDKNLNLTFHTFPKENDRVVYLTNYFGQKEKIDKLKAWKKVTKVKIVHKTTTVCSRHFKTTDYIFPDRLYL